MANACHDSSADFHFARGVVAAIAFQRAVSPHSFESPGASNAVHYESKAANDI